MPELDPIEEPLSKGSRLISKVLAPAMRLWVRSQVEHVDELQIDLQAGDREILSGYIQQVALSAQNAVYQGLTLSEIRLVGQNIRVNLGQVVRGKPLRILEPIPIQGSARLVESDLNASLNAPLLKSGVTEFLLTLLQSGAPELGKTDLNLQNLQIKLQERYVVIGATIISTSGNETPIAIRTGFKLASPNLLALVDPQWLPHFNAKRGLAIADLNGYTFNLGDETEIQALTLTQGQVACEGKLLVQP